MRYTPEDVEELAGVLENPGVFNASQHCHHSYQMNDSGLLWNVTPEEDDGLEADGAGRERRPVEEP